MTAIALGALALMGATPLLAFLSAALLGLATGPMNPVGSHVLARISPPGWAAFIFSVKQCATPGGGALAGILFPSLVLIWGWQNAFLIIPVAAVLFLLAIRFCGLDSDTDNRSTNRTRRRPAARSRSLRLSLATRRIAATSMACMLFWAVRSAVAIVVYLADQCDVRGAGRTGVFLFHAAVSRPLVFGWFADDGSRLPPLGVLLQHGGLAGRWRLFDRWSQQAMFTVIAFAGCTGNGTGRLALRGLARLARKERPPM